MFVQSAVANWIGTIFMLIIFNPIAREGRPNSIMQPFFVQSTTLRKERNFAKLLERRLLVKRKSPASAGPL